VCWVVVCDLETSRMGAPYIYIYIYDISRLRVKFVGYGVYILCIKMCIVYESDAQNFILTTICT